MDYKNIIMNKSSVRDYKEKKVDENKLLKIMTSTFYFAIQLIKIYAKNNE